MGDTQTELSHTTLKDVSIINTRALTQSKSLTESLSCLGAQVIEAPMIAFDKPSNESFTKDAVAHIEVYDWLIFTSVNAVEHFFTYLVAADKTAADITAHIASVGKATSAALEAQGLKVNLVPTTQATAEGLIEAFSSLGKSLRGLKMLMPRAQQAREILPAWLEEQGVELLVAPVYQTAPQDITHDLAQHIKARLAQESGRASNTAIIFTSPSTVNSFVASLQKHAINPNEFAACTVAFSVGPVTTRAIQAQGLSFKSLVEAQESYLASLIDAITNYYAGA